MFLQRWHILVAVVLLVVGCGALAAPADEKATRTDGPGQVADSQRSAISNQPSVEVLARRVAELEARLDALRWTKQDAIVVVRSELWQRARDCYAITKLGGECPGSMDPVLKAYHVGAGNFMPEFSVIAWKVMAKFFLERGEWSATYEPESFRWRVESTFDGDTWGVRTAAFLVYEKTGLVEGITPESVSKPPTPEPAPLTPGQQRALDEILRRPASCSMPIFGCPTQAPTPTPPPEELSEREKCIRDAQVKHRALTPPPTLPPPEELSEIQKRVRDCILSGKPPSR
jgi:hypothetical protein